MNWLSKLNDKINRFNLTMGTWMMETRSGNVTFNAVSVVLLVGMVAGFVYRVSTGPSVPLWPYTQL